MRPNIAYLVQTLSQYVHKPNKLHIDAALQIVRYIKGNRSLTGAVFDKQEHIEFIIYVLWQRLSIMCSLLWTK